MQLRIRLRCHCKVRVCSRESIFAVSVKCAFAAKNLSSLSVLGARLQPRISLRCQCQVHICSLESIFAVSVRCTFVAENRPLRLQNIHLSTTKFCRPRTLQLWHRPPTIETEAPEEIPENLSMVWRLTSKIPPTESNLFPLSTGSEFT